MTSSRPTSFWPSQRDPQRGPGSPNGNGAGRPGDSTLWERLQEDAFFPVCEEPLKLSDGRILDSHRAILHADYRKVLSVVSGGYRQGADGSELERRSGGYQLITNEAAVEAGKEVFAMVFGRGAAGALRPLNLTMPKPAASCSPISPLPNLKPCW